ncbi:efflux RND transporter periplasmic adaptor subunit [Pseudobutyrivibrio xylanivorans]|uniref:HlyD family efflux transporter periplasmic adaptor subunit n=1 Tax=Pseudobutyrivibrio xylanivorans TaxID=185007 RepID=A0A5P6VVB4_PSEXY|nr:efflux RND transporter periplasmic adaptor subunit [Pseudobutyrivibrio xylanivorans]QFJ55849.1 HlyD family efflux transporter periplasmic adaptor subunit [Pseudobutyrivibrio xylanivorans]
MNKKTVLKIVAGVVVVSMVCGGVYFKFMKPQDIEVETVPTVNVTKQTIEKTISATGSIIAAQETTALASTTGTYPVAEVYVSIGDEVKVGDPLYKLDMSEKQNELSYQQKAYSLLQQKNDIAMANAELELDKQLDAGAVKVVDSNKEVADANKSKEDNESKVKKAEDALGDARRAADRAESDMNAASESGDQAAYAAARDKYDAALSAVRSAESALTTAKEAVKDADKKIETSTEAQGRTQKEMDRENLFKSRAIESAKLDSQANTIDNQKAIATTKAELDKATVYATQDGVVTNVNIKPGQTYSGAEAAVVIDDMTTLKASADIDEALIPKIKLGQTVNIKTDATEDEVLTGKVTFISPTATKDSDKDKKSDSSTASVSKKRATYRVDVTLDGVNEVLRLGMTAKMTFLIDKKDNVLAVPSAIIQKDEEGKDYVVVQKSEGETENVTVTTGLSDDYYTEVSGTGIKEGKVIIDSNEAGIDDMLLSMGADGGINVD